MMLRLEHLLDQLIDGFAVPHVRGLREHGLVVSGLDLDLPVEARIAPDASLLLTLPRGVLATGFTVPMSRMQLHCEETVP